MKPGRSGLVESPSFSLVRWTAATLALAAGIIHLAQIGPHNDEDPLFGIFFLGAGMFQIGGGLYLSYPLGRERARTVVGWFGIVGSLATIGIWAVSRTTGLPFGAEPGAPETIGLADAAADLFELFTALLLGMWIFRAHLRPPVLAALAILGAVGALALAGLWLATRGLGWFDPDPRLVVQSELTDLAAVGFLVLLATLFVRLLVAVPRAERSPRVTSYALLATLVLAELSLVAFTLPARGGQNRDCLYAPIREDSGLSHAKPVKSIRMDVGEIRSIVVLLLVACADAPVTLTGIELAHPVGNAAEIVAITIDRSRTERRDRVRDAAGGGVPIAGAVLVPGQGRYPVVVTIQGIEPGPQALAAFNVRYEFKREAGAIGFASSTYVCVGGIGCPPLATQ